MLIVRPQTNAALERASASEFVQQLARWLQSRPELFAWRSVVSESWVHGEMDLALSYGIESEDAVARFCRLRLLRDTAWFDQPEQQEILQSGREGNLKIFQLECCDEGIVDDYPGSVPATPASGGHNA